MSYEKIRLTVCSEQGSKQVVPIAQKIYAREVPISGWGASLSEREARSLMEDLQEALEKLARQEGNPTRPV